MKRALLPGTFDPPSLGHLDIISRALQICDSLYIGIARNVTKEQALFTVEERGEMLQEVTSELSNVQIVYFDTLVVDFAREHKVDFLVRGLRAFADFEYEFRMALANRRMGGIETVFLMADERHAYISSSLIRELGHYRCRLHAFVPQQIETRVFDRLAQLRQ